MNSSSSSALRVIAAALLAGVLAGGQAQETVRPEVGKILQDASALIKAQKYKEALAKVRDADAVPNKSANDSLTIERMRMAAASGAGDTETAARAFDAVNASGKLPAADKLRMMESLAGSYYRARDYPKAITWSQRYLKEGGSNGAIRNLLIQSQYLGGDTAGAARELVAEIQADEKNGRAPAEERLNLLLNAAMRQADGRTDVFALERLVTYYPKKEYWAELLNRVQRKQEFSDRFALDAYRLMLATGSMRNANDYMEMTQLALQAGFAAEAKAAIDKGFAANVLGTGAEADRQKRLRDLAYKKADEDKATLAEREAQAAGSKDAAALVSIGFNQALAGQGAKGVALIEKGIAIGGLKRPEDAKLRLGQALVLAGESAKATSVLRSVVGTDGAADLARLWTLLGRRKT